MIGTTSTQCLHSLLRVQAEQSPDVTALLAPGRPPLTFSRLYRQVEAVVRRLNSLGVGRGDRVAIVLPDGPEMAMAFLAVAAGATSAPLNPANQVNEFEYSLADLEARAVIVPSGSSSPVIAAARGLDIPLIELSPLAGAPAGTFTLTGEKQPACGPGGFAQAEDVALVLHTSGTTSRPKVVPLTHSNLCASARHLCTARELACSDRCLNLVPLFHIYALITLLSALAAGASFVCTPGFDALQFTEWMEEFRPSWYTAVPAMHQVILEQVDSQRGTIARCPLRFIPSSGAPLPPPVIRRLEDVFGAPVTESYGTSETSLITANPLPPRARKAGSVGMTAGPEVAIMDETGCLLPPGSTGEVVVRGPNVMHGYENDPAANRTAFINGWFRTGDEGFLDQDSYLFLTGRLKEMINRGGEKISPREVDEVLLDHPAVAQATTFAIPDATLGEEVGAAIVMREGAEASAGEIRAFAASRLADFKVPRQVVFVEEIPKGPTGKPQRISLAEKLGLTEGSGAGQRATDFVAPRTPLEKILTEIGAQVLGLERIGVNDNFFALGGHSLSASRFFSRVREVLQVQLPMRRLFETPTVAGLSVAVAGAMAKQREKEGTAFLLAEVENLSEAEARERLAGGAGQGTDNTP